MLNGRLLLVVPGLIGIAIASAGAPRQQLSPSHNPVPHVLAPQSAQSAARLQNKKQSGDSENAATPDHSYDPMRVVNDVEVGDFYLRRGNYPGALGRFEDALQYDRDNGEALYGAGRAELKLGHREQASRYFNRYLEAVPGGKREKAIRKELQKLDSETAKTSRSSDHQTIGAKTPRSKPDVNVAAHR